MILQRIRTSPVYHTYYKDGNASNISIKDESTPTILKDLALYYARNGTLWIAMWDEWGVPDTDAPTPYTRLAAREFRYDSARGRYLHRKLNPATLLPDSSEAMHWTDYLGGGLGVSPDNPWGDFDSPVGSSTPTEITRYFPGMGTQGKQNASTSAVSYFHGDLIDSTVLSTTGAGATGGTTIYTAFGEIVGTPGADAGRYQYGGGWGYESGLISVSGANAALAPITLQHVGHRWYQPAIGRFIQRDPVGLLGGINCYVYSRPMNSVDPDGLDRWIVDEGIHRYYVLGPIDTIYYRVDFRPRDASGSGRSSGSTSGAGSALVGPVTGQVDVTRIPARPSRPADVPSTEPRDRRLLKKMLRTKAPDYHVTGFNCRHHSQHYSKDP